jgi:signal peptidase I
MAPGITEGDLIVIDKSVTKIKRGQLIVFRLSDDKYILKRVIAIAGDSLIYNDKQVYLQRNDGSCEDQ